MDELQKKLEETRRQGEEKRTEEIAQKLGLNYLNLTLVPIQRDSLGLIPQTEAERTQTVVLQKKGQTLKVGAVDLKNQETVQVLEQLKTQGFNVETFVISRSSLKRALDEFKFLPSQTIGEATSGEVRLEQVETLKKELISFEALKNKLSGLGETNVSQLLEIFLSAALNLEASDIHVEPQETLTQVRIRLDGVLQNAGTLEKTIYQSVLSRVKLLSGLQLNVQNIPQDGRFTIKENDTEIEVRTSILPGAYGEYVVLRILNPNAIKLEIKDLGLRDYFWNKLEKEIKKPNGIILVTGPTGSGKTTTLYAFLKYLNKPGVKIVTLEDPIEYHLAGINQSQIEPEKGYTFAQGLRSVLRQDPNIILVGEIRDEETADTSLHAALTGHSVFSTLHTNDAIGAIPRFLDLNAKPQILSSALNAAVGQRLLRKLCSACKKVSPNTVEEIEKIKKALYTSAEIEKVFPLPNDAKVYESTGCEKCGQTGYKGRVGVFEILLVDEPMEKLIGASPSNQQILDEAKKSGFVTMYQDGLMRVISGETTLAEVERVTGAGT